MLSKFSVKKPYTVFVGVVLVIILGIVSFTKMTTDLFEFTTSQEADIRIPRVGGNAGKATLLLDGSVTSNYFIKNKTTYSNEEFVEIINDITFPSINFTVGPKSLPKGELILEIEESVNLTFPQKRCIILL